MDSVYDDYCGRTGDHQRWFERNQTGDIHSCGSQDRRKRVVVMDGKYGRTRKIMKMDGQKHYNGLEKLKPDEKEVINYRRPAYPNISVVDYVKKCK